MNPVVTIIGPTSSGKTDLSIHLSQALNASIMNLDSVQIYRELNIGSGKPTQEDLLKYPQLFINIASIQSPLTSYDIFKKSYKTIQELQNKNKNIILTGGTGLYYKNLLFGMFEGPLADINIRQILIQSSNDKLYQQLMQVDPQSAQSIHPNDYIRIERALEIYYTTGITASKHKEKQIYYPPADFLFIGLDIPRPALYNKINERVDKMIEDGLIDEVKKIISQTPNYKLLNKIIGYKEILQYLNNEFSLEDAIELIKKNTRRFAKRQMTLFRKLPNIRWFPSNDWEVVFEYIISQYPDFTPRVKSSNISIS